MSTFPTQEPDFSEDFFLKLVNNQTHHCSGTDLSSLRLIQSGQKALTPRQPLQVLRAAVCDVEIYDVFHNLLEEPKDGVRPVYYYGVCVPHADECQGTPVSGEGVLFTATGNNGLEQSFDAFALMHLSMFLRGIGFLPAFLRSAYFNQGGLDEQLTELVSVLMRSENYACASQVTALWRSPVHGTVPLTIDIKNPMCQVGVAKLEDEPLRHHNAYTLDSKKNRLAKSASGDLFYDCKIRTPLTGFALLDMIPCIDRENAFVIYAHPRHKEYYDRFEVAPVYFIVSIQPDGCFDIHRADADECQRYAAPYRDRFAAIDLTIQAEFPQALIRP